LNLPHGLPYNYYPAIYCFDEYGGSVSCFKSSIINIRCNDKANTIGGSGASCGKSVVIVIVNIVVLIVMGIAEYCYWKRFKDHGQSICPFASKTRSTKMMTVTVDTTLKVVWVKVALLEEAVSPEAVAPSVILAKNSRNSASRGSRDIDEFVDDTLLSANDADAKTNANSVKTPDTVYLPIVEEPSEPSYVDEVIEDPINDLRDAEPIHSLNTSEARHL
jgi:hypothetical protein